MWNLSEEVCLVARDQLFHCLKVLRERFEAFVPSLRIRRRFGGGPVTGGPVRRDMLCIARKLQDVPLRDPHVLEQFPDRVRQPARTSTSQFRGNAAERSFPIGMSAASGEKIHEMSAQYFFLHRLLPHFPV